MVALGLAESGGVGELLVHLFLFFFFRFPAVLLACVCSVFLLNCWVSACCYCFLFPWFSLFLEPWARLEPKVSLESLDLRLKPSR